MGDSYASGIGAGALPQTPDPDRCFRCSNAYPELIQSGPGSLQPNPEKFNFVACSGATFSEIFEHQTIDQGGPGRPAWGDSPEFVTITMGGNDIGILHLVLTCIYSVPILAIGCDAVIQRGFDILNSDDFKIELRAVIRGVRDKGRSRYGRAFHIFVTGYAQLFNNVRAQCDQVTFKPDSVMLPAQHLTRARRTRMNELAFALNRALQTAVETFSPLDVTFVDYDDLFEGHRFCDRDEPSPNDDQKWFFQLGTTSDPTNEATGLNEVPGTNDTGNAVAPAVVRKDIPHDGESNGDERTSTPRRGSTLSPRNITIPSPVGVAYSSDYFRVFHPKSFGHQAIRGAILEAIDSLHLLRSTGATNASYNTS